MTDTPTREQVETLVASVKVEADKQRRLTSPLVPVLDEAADTLAALQSRVEELNELLRTSLSTVRPLHTCQQVVVLTNRIAALESDLATARAALDLRERMEEAGIVVWRNPHTDAWGMQRLGGFERSFSTRAWALAAAAQLLDQRDADSRTNEGDQA